MQNSLIVNSKSFIDVPNERLFQTNDTVVVVPFYRNQFVFAYGMTKAGNEAFYFPQDINPRQGAMDAKTKAIDMIRTLFGINQYQDVKIIEQIRERNNATLSFVRYDIDPRIDPRSFRLSKYDGVEDIKIIGNQQELNQLIRSNGIQDRFTMQSVNLLFQ